MNFPLVVRILLAFRPEISVFGIVFQRAFPATLKQAYESVCLWPVSDTVKHDRIVILQWSYGENSLERIKSDSIPLTWLNLESLGISTHVSTWLCSNMTVSKETVANGNQGSCNISFAFRTLVRFVFRNVKPEKISGTSFLNRFGNNDGTDRYIALEILSYELLWGYGNTDCSISYFKIRYSRIHNLQIDNL